MIAQLQAERPGLSSSKVAEWRLWTYIVATAIHAFELILDLFRKEVDELTNRITPGSETWYKEMCLRFQNGHELLFDNENAMLYYEADAPDTRIVKVVAVKSAAEIYHRQISLKVAKFDTDGKVIPLSEDELYNFTGYVQVFKFADDPVDIVSTTADKILYDLEVFYEPAIPVTVVRGNVLQALSDFRLKLDFNAMFYPQRLLDVLLSVKGVVTADLKTIKRKGATDPDFEEVSVMSELQSGYFEYADDCVLAMTSIKA